MDNITWLGQAGLLLEHTGRQILIDPYLSDSVEKVNPLNRRRVAVDERFLAVKPDMLIFTHDHLDHYDPETVCHYLGSDTAVTVLAPGSVWEKVRTFGGADNNYVLFNRHTRWSQFGLSFTAVKAEHSDPASIGVIIESGDKKYYITGDTLYNEEIFADIPGDIYALFLPVNGKGNNMNMTDAAHFAQRVDARKVVPLHFGLFDTIDPADFPISNKVIPEFYKEIKL